MAECEVPLLTSMELALIWESLKGAWQPMAARSLPKRAADDTCEVQQARITRALPSGQPQIRHLMRIPSRLTRLGVGSKSQ